MNRTYARSKDLLLGKVDSSSCKENSLIFKLPVREFFTSSDILAYADDIAIINDNLEELQNDVTKANEVIEWLGMKVKPSKCALLVVNPAQRKCGRRIFEQDPKIL